MRFLLDTHVLIWWARSEPLSPAATEAIGYPSNEVFVSAASVWEAAVKVAAGKLRLGRDLAQEALAHGFAPLSIGFAHSLEAGRLPAHHADPFDRMLIAQARLEELTLITRDPRLTAYGVALLEA